MNSTPTIFRSGDVVVSLSGWLPGVVFPAAPGLSIFAGESSAGGEAPRDPDPGSGGRNIPARAMYPRAGRCGACGTELRQLGDEAWCPACGAAAPANPHPERRAA
jgi:hypothetical protein